ncbi:MAG: phytanoyl-CoA dioxygenase family protein [Alphaproteobacteria bacterium]|nr:phytanoyl-CoA dioxygenase family protein [Alphaproteobacteria bacterium]
MPKLQTLPADAPIETVMAALDRDGALILEALISADEADAVAAELDPFVQATPVGQDVFSGFKTTRTGALAARSPWCGRLMLDARVRAVCDKVLLANCERYQLHLGQVIRIMPGQPAQAIHRDRWAWGTHLKGVEPQLNTIWALTDFTKENGATQVVPGSQHLPDNATFSAEEIGYAEMKKGSALVYTGTVFHGGGANVTDHDRIGLNITYALGWLRQEENQYLSCPPEVARTLDPDLQGLLGYAMGGYALGYFTPPLPAGEGPGLAPPEYALHGGGRGGSLGSNAALSSLSAQVRA